MLTTIGVELLVKNPIFINEENTINKISDGDNKVGKAKS